MTGHAHTVNAAPRMPAGNYTGLSERLEDASVREEFFNLGFLREHEVLELGVPLEHEALGVRVEAEIADQRSLPLSRRQAGWLWGAANRVTRVIVSGSTAVGSATGTFVSNATVSTITGTFASSSTLGSITATFVSNATVGSITGTFVSDATVGSITGTFVSNATGANTATVATTSQRDHISSLRAELLALRADLANWDEEDGKRPNEEAFDDAHAFIELIPSGVPLPSLYVSGDAEVGLSWMWNDGFIEVAFRGDGKIRYAARFDGDLNGHVCEFRRGRVPIAPLPLMTALKRL
jgi:hypothetical protein